jgi:[acyl-carrier-protein] S-malonyltransferase
MGGILSYGRKKLMMEKKLIFLFPGQGAQFPGMGIDLIAESPAAAKIFDLASETLGRDMVSLVRDSDAEFLKRTDISQPAMSAASLAAAACLKERGFEASGCAGFSLGEYPAFVCAGVISAADCFRLTEARGKAMQAAADKIAASGDGAAASAPGMAAVIGLSPERVEELIRSWKSEPAGGQLGLFAANINSPRQVVVSGTAAALAEAEVRFKNEGARRVIRLAVAGPFHSPFMKEASDAFAPVLKSISFNDPAIPLFSNVTGKQIKSGEEAKSLALRHMCEGVRWTEEEAAIAALSPDGILETGPGKVLQGLWRDTGSAVPSYGAGTLEEIESLSKLFEKL